MNTTDVDDKTIKGASLLAGYDKNPEEILKEFTRGFEKLFWGDLRALNIQQPKHVTRATDYISAMERLVEKITQAGFAYEKDGSVYFSVEKYTKAKKYGQLVDIDISQQLSAARIDADEYEKENAQDFALWKKASVGEPSWDLALDGKTLPGRPGWHLECSAMAHEVLQYPFDIHTGGVDLRFPHHENEIAQSIAGYGKIPAHFWVHNNHLLVDGKKMAKSEGNFITLQTLVGKEISPLAFRYWLLTADYKKTVNFTWEALDSAQTALHRLYESSAISAKEKPSFLVNLFSSTKPDTNYKEKFTAIINDDIDTPKAIALAWELVRDTSISPAKKYATLLDFDKVFGLGLATYKPVEIPADIKELAEKREQYRKEKNWAESDRMREEIESKGFEVKDTDEGYSIVSK